MLGVPDKHTGQQRQAGDRLELLSQGVWLAQGHEPQGKPRYLDRKAKQGFYSPDFDDHSSESRKLLQKANSAA